MTRVRPILVALALVSACGPRTQPTAAPVAPTEPAPAPTPAPIAEAAPAPAPEPTAPAVDPNDPFAFLVDQDGILRAEDVAKLPAVGGSPLVRLDEPGAEPRTELRYAVDNVGKGAISMVMDMNLVVRMGDQVMSSSTLPRMIMTLDVVAAKPTANDVHLTGTVRTSKLDAPTDAERKLAEAMGTKLAALVGMTTRYRMDRRGFVSDASIVTPKGLSPEMADTAEQMRQSLTSLAVPMPEEPVGPGARWRVLKRMVAGGVDTVQLAAYTITAIEGDDVTLAVEIAQFSASRAVTTKGVQAELLRYRAVGEGTSTMSRADPLRGAAKAGVAADLEMKVTAAGTDVTMGVAVTMATTLEATAKPRKKKKKA